MKKALRIKKNEEFSNIIKQRHSYASANFVLYKSIKKETNVRVGISVSKKLGDAVTRNKIKRQVREICHLVIDFENGMYDYVIIVRQSYKNNDFHYNKNDLEKLYKKSYNK